MIKAVLYVITLAPLAVAYTALGFRVDFATAIYCGIVAIDLMIIAAISDAWRDR